MINNSGLKNIHDYILEISSKDLQINYWLVGDTGRITGYVELMCGLFDDNDFDYFVDKGAIELNFPAAFIQELELLRDELNMYNEEGKSQEEIINDKKWEEISLQAQKVLELWDVNPSVSTGSVSN